MKNCFYPNLSRFSQDLSMSNFRFDIIVTYKYAFDAERILSRWHWEKIKRIVCFCQHADVTDNWGTIK